MKKKAIMAVIAVAGVCWLGCSRENSRKDRSQASEMFERICRLTREYTEKLQEAPDSTDWATLGNEFEEKLDKISFSYAPDTDLLLTEGQNDTIHSLMQEYVKARRIRIRGILRHETEGDSLMQTDSLETVETQPESTVR